MNLGYVPVDKNKISLDEYKKFTDKFASEQRKLLDYINAQKIDPIQLDLNLMNGRIKTRTKDTWNFGQFFSFTATYTVFGGKTVSKCWDASLNMKDKAVATGTYLTDISSPTYALIDSGRTASVKYTATIYYAGNIGYSNSILYTEFYYDD